MLVMRFKIQQQKVPHKVVVPTQQNIHEIYIYIVLYIYI